MSAIRIVLCKNAHEANVMFHVLQGDGYDCPAPGPSVDFVFWDATQANPSDPEMIFKNHIVLIGTKP